MRKYLRYTGLGLGGLVLLAVVASVLIDDNEETVQPYARVPVPAVPEATSFFGAVGELADGQYWVAEIEGNGEGGWTLTVQQAFFGPRCEAELGADACDGDYGVRTEWSRSVGVDPAALESITVVAANRQNYAVFADELGNLLVGAEPSADAPDDYAFVPYPFLATVRGGAVVQLRQIWVP